MIRVSRVFAFTLISFLFSFSAVSAQVQPVALGSVSGQVTEKLTGRPIVGATISVGDRTTTSDESGRYRLELPAGSYNVSFRAQGFADVLSGQVTVTASRVFVLDMQLSISLEQITVDVESSAFETTAELPVSQTVFNRDEIRVTPGSGGDPLRAINSLPGVTVQSGEFADLIVRGGSTGENLTFIENIPLSDFTLFTDKYDGGRSGRATFLPPDVFSRVDFSAGGFGVRYGDKMSSVLDVTLREPNKERFQGVGFVDSGGAGISFDTPLGERGGLLTSIRRSYIDVAFDLFDIADIGRPRNWDIINKGTFQINDRNKLSITSLVLLEQYTLNDEQASNSDRTRDRLRTDRKSRRAIVGATLFTNVGDTALSRVTFWTNYRRSEGTLFRLFSSTLQRSRDLKDMEFGIKEEFTASINPKLQLAAGGGFIYSKSDYSSFEKAGLGFSPLEEEYLAPDRTSVFAPGGKVSSYAYAQLTWNPKARLAITPQIRIDRIGLTKETLASPRISARYTISEKLFLNAAAGIYRQTPDVFNFTVSSNRNLKSQSATQVVGGFEWMATRDVRVRAEVFDKRYRRLVVRPFNNFTSLTNDGEGYARGLELSAQRSLTGNFSGQLSYSFVRSRRSLCDGCILFPSDTERPHQLIILGITRVKGFTVGAKYRLASGLPYSVRTPVTISPGTFVHRIQNVVDTNAARLPKFSSFDVRVERKFDFRNWSIAPFFDLFNVFASNEGSDVNYEFNRATPKLIGEGTRLPIIGLRVEF